MLALKLIAESLSFAWKALRSNLLRTVLSLLGVTIGIFSIIAVLTLVDSLKKNILDSLNFLGSDVIYVHKWPWGAGDRGRDWWKEYIKRPHSSFAEYRFLKNNLQTGQVISIYADEGGNATIKAGSNGINKIEVDGVSLDFEKLFEFNIENGRYLTSAEIEGGRNVVVIGYEVAKALYPKLENPVGEYVKIKNLKFKIVGTVKREGESFMGFTSKDFSCFIPYDAFRKMYQTGTGRWNEIGSIIGMKGYPGDIGLVELENEARGLLRVKRGLKPSQKDNFTMNRPEAIAKSLDGVFDVLGIAGWIIGGFSMLVGGFGIANIMFVSVKERTNIIGIQKSLGAKNYFIMLQFLIEAVLLCIMGGAIGIGIVYGGTFLVKAAIDIQIVLYLKNIILGVSISIAIGIIAGIVPAWFASRLDPVEAIRTN